MLERLACLCGAVFLPREPWPRLRAEMSCPRGPPTGSHPAARSPQIQPIAVDLFLHVVWENLSHWKDDNLFFPLPSLQ